MATVHFLLVYDLTEQRLLSQQMFEDPSLAIAEYSRLEASHRDDRSIEIVLVGADSIETIMQTHEQYFQDASLAESSRYLVTSA